MSSKSRWLHLIQIIWPVAAAGYLLIVAIVLPGYIRASVADFPLIQRGLSLLTGLIGLGLAALLYARPRDHTVALNLSSFLLGLWLIPEAANKDRQGQ